MKRRPRPSDQPRRLQEPSESGTRATTPDCVLAQPPVTALPSASLWFKPVVQTVHVAKTTFSKMAKEQPGTTVRAHAGQSVTAMRSEYSPRVRDLERIILHLWRRTGD